METSRKRIGRVYAPLTIAESIACTTPSSLPTQVYNSFNAEYEADRTLTPCVLQPIVVAKALDGSWANPNVNSQLAEMKWFVNDKEISTVSEWQGKYSINTDNGPERGAITIRYNVPPEKKYSLRFTAVIADERTGLNYKVSTDAVILSTTDKSDDDYTVNVGTAPIIRYNPLFDKLLLYTHKVANGLIEPSADAANAAQDNNGFICNIPINVMKGKEKATNYTVTLYRRNNDVWMDVNEVPDKQEVIGVALTAITLDLRLIEKADYLIAVNVDGEVKAYTQFSINRIYPKFRCQPTNGTAIGPDDTQRYDKAMVDSNGKIVECPELFFRIIWKTDTAKRKNVIHNEGVSTVFDLDKTGIGKTINDDWLDVYTDTEYKKAYTVATDNSGNIFTDENNNPLIFN